MKRKHIMLLVDGDIRHESDVSQVAILTSEQLLRIVAQEAPVGEVLPWDCKESQVVPTYSLRGLVHFMEWAKANHPKIVEEWEARKGTYPEVLGPPLAVEHPDYFENDPDGELPPWLVNKLGHK